MCHSHGPFHKTSCHNPLKSGCSDSWRSASTEHQQRSTLLPDTKRPHSPHSVCFAWRIHPTKQVFHARITHCAHAVGLHAVTLKLKGGSVLFSDFRGVDVRQANRTGCSHVFQRTDVHLGIGLRGVIGFKPHQIATPALLPPMRNTAVLSNALRAAT